MHELSNRPLAWKRPLLSDGLIGQFEVGPRQMSKSSDQALPGGYQPCMPQSQWGKRVPRLERIPFQLPVNIEQMGENIEPIEQVYECVSIKQRGRQVITAVGNAAHQLRLFSWRVNADGVVVRTGMSDIQTGWVAQVAIARARKFVTAFRTATRQLQLVSWDVSNTGAIYRAGASNLPMEQGVGVASDIVDKVKLIALNDTLLVTTCTTPTGQIKLSSWRLNDNDSLTRLHDFTAIGDLAREIISIVLPSTVGARLVTALRTRSGQLKLQLWQVATTGEITTDAVGIVAEEKISQFDVVADAQGRLITAVRTLGGRLKLIAWHCAADGQKIERLYDSGTHGERIRKHSLMLHVDQIVTAVQLAAGQDKLMAWAISAAGSIVQVGESPVQSGVGVPMGLCQEALDGNAPLLTSGLTADGALKLMTWHA
ncbi:hypothetical protein BH10CHL1_BH10CHL1_27830 [soil metagenome]